MVEWRLNLLKIMEFYEKSQCFLRKTGVDSLLYLYYDS